MQESKMTPLYVRHITIAIKLQASFIALIWPLNPQFV